MTIDHTAIDTLADKLEQPSAEPLTDNERALLAAALRRLIAGEAIIATQERVLTLQGQSRRRIAAIADDAVAGLRDALGASPAGDVAADAGDARRELLDEIQRAASARDTFRSALRFVRALIG